MSDQIQPHPNYIQDNMDLVDGIPEQFHIGYQFPEWTPLSQPLGTERRQDASIQTSPGRPELEARPQGRAGLLNAISQLFPSNLQPRRAQAIYTRDQLDMIDGIDTSTEGSSGESIENAILGRVPQFNNSRIQRFQRAALQNPPPAPLHSQQWPTPRAADPRIHMDEMVDYFLSHVEALIRIIHAERRRDRAASLKRLERAYIGNSNGYENRDHWDENGEGIGGMIAQAFDGLRQQEVIASHNDVCNYLVHYLREELEEGEVWTRINIAHFRQWQENRNDADNHFQPARANRFQRSGLDDHDNHSRFLVLSPPPHPRIPMANDQIHRSPYRISLVLTRSLCADPFNSQHNPITYRVTTNRDNSHIDISTPNFGSYLFSASTQTLIPDPEFENVNFGQGAGNGIRDFWTAMYEELFVFMERSVLDWDEDDRMLFEVEMGRMIRYMTHLYEDDEGGEDEEEEICFADLLGLEMRDMGYVSNEGVWDVDWEPEDDLSNNSSNDEPEDDLSNNSSDDESDGEESDDEYEEGRRRIRMDWPGEYERRDMISVDPNREIEWLRIERDELMEPLPRYEKYEKDAPPPYVGVFGSIYDRLMRKIGRR